MARIMIYGAGDNGKSIYHNDLRGRDDVVCFIDSAEHIHGSKISDVSVIAPCEINNYDYDYIIVSVSDVKAKAEIVDSLARHHSVPIEKIEDDYFDLLSFRLKARRTFLRCFSDFVRSTGISGSVAEAGVYRGEFARYISLCFPDRTLYLFDTFEGFPECDVEAELALNSSYSFPLDFKDGSIEQVMSVMPNTDKVVIRQGAFPESTGEIDDKFVFVNLDMDLYKPTLAGLEYFYPKMMTSGIIMVHDYFRNDLQGVRTAVHEFCDRHKLVFSVCSDECSVVITKHKGE